MTNNRFGANEKRNLLNTYVVWFDITNKWDELNKGDIIEYKQFLHYRKAQEDITYNNYGGGIIIFKNEHFITVKNANGYNISMNKLDLLNSNCFISKKG